MNSLEYIDEEIKRYKAVISITSGKKKSYYKKVVNKLKQIKSELEAWYVVKKHLEYFPSDYYNGIPEDVITMTSEIDKIDYSIIKKALEVKDEKSN